jgi:hypothetical protein
MQIQDKTSSPALLGGARLSKWDDSQNHTIIQLFATVQVLNHTFHCFGLQIITSKETQGESSVF